MYMSHSPDIYLLSAWNPGTEREPDRTKKASKETPQVFVLVSSDDGKTLLDTFTL
jgi:hypothetical protein